MAEILIPDVPDEVLAAIDAGSRRLGLSRSEYLLRVLHRESRVGTRPVSLDDLKRLARLTQDINNPKIMSGAWS